MAVPEKALLDLFYFLQGEWTVERIKEMRFQNLQDLDFPRFKRYVKQFHSPKIEEAAHTFLNLSFSAVLA